MSKAIPGSDAAVYESEKDMATRARLGKKMLTTDDEPFDLDITDGNRVVRSQDLDRIRNLGEAELAAHLYFLNVDRAYLSLGFDTLTEFVEAPKVATKAGEQIGLGMLSSKANAMIKTWKMFTDIGLMPCVLSADPPVSWAKFKALTRGIKAGVITEANIAEWLPLITENGPHSMRQKDVLARVNLAVEYARHGGMLNEDELDSQCTRLITWVPTNDLELLATLEKVVMQAGEIDPGEPLARGKAMLMAMQNFATAITDGNTEAWQHLGLDHLRQIAEITAPGVSCVFIAQESDNLEEHDLGVLPATKIYQGFVTRDGQKVPRFIIATSEEEARAELGTDELRDYPLEVSTRLRTPLASPESEAPKEVAVETAPPKKRRRKKAKVAAEVVPETEFSCEAVHKNKRSKVLKALAIPLIEKRIVNNEMFTNALASFKKDIGENTEDSEYQIFEKSVSWLQEHLSVADLTVDLMEFV
jgi:hypothetical protein